ncbi:MAG: 30S ribosomal protein S12 methylthiotransferase RimO [Clostridia bacterium]|nr:30S ribosomal protein S12 methylthiotransferase RimO [Clostridia bacterium]
MMPKIGFISLGCPKNQVDAELMLDKLVKAGYEIAGTAEEADAVIVNTCGFIDAAKQEAIDNILEMGQLKADGAIQKIIVTGCLAERYRDEILKEMPEVDAVVGIGGNADIVKTVEDVFAGETVSAYPPKKDLPLCGERLLSTPPWWAYLKIADGCSNCCTYCAIPQIRGPMRSRTIESIVDEAKTLAGKGVKELIVIAQDTTRYGEDLYGEPKLAALLRELVKLDGIEWIRLLYCYPDRLTDELLATIRDNDKVLNYIDLPLQHADGRILKAMNRHGDKETLLALIKKIRDYLPDGVIRTTFITGFPGEDDAAFETLSDFVEQAQFDRLGCFAYSREEGTKAAEMPDQVDPEIAAHRGEIIMEQQYDIFTDKQQDLIGTVQRCVIDDYGDEPGTYAGRTWMDAPEIDSAITVISKRPLTPGDFIDVEITGTDEYDLIGETI